MSGVAPPLGQGLRVRLSLMMLLQYAIWGAWLPILYPYLTGHRGFTLDQCGLILAVGAVGAIVGPFIAGQVADRHFATEKFLGLSHLAGATMAWFLPAIERFGSFLALSLVYGMVYAPTLSLTNSLSFHHLPDRDRDFGKVRVWGTIGWIAAGITVGQWLLYRHTPAGPEATRQAIEAAQAAGMADAFRLTGLLGALMGLFCFTLPHTPPSRGARRSATAEAMIEIRRRPLLVLFLLAVPVSCIHQFYFVHTAQFLKGYQAQAEGFLQVVNRIFGVGGGGLMTIGQMTEVLVLAAIPLVAKTLSRKTLLGIGLAAYAARMLLFAQAATVGPAGLILGVAMHGLCFGCFIFVAFMVVDEETTADVRASAQSLFNLVIVGIGIIVGSWFATSVVGNWASPGGEMDYSRLFSVPMWMALGCLALLFLLYPGRNRLAALRAERTR